MRNLLLLVALAVLGTGYSQSRSFRARFEMGFMGGGSYYIGDLSNGKHFSRSRLALGGIVRYNLSSRASLRFTGTYGTVWGSDARSDDPVEVNRNLDFTSKIYELAAGIEIDLFKYRINDMKYPISPYFFYEIAYFRMNPTTSYEGNEIELQSLGTEGQGTSLSDKRKYSLNQISLPVGIGVKCNIKKRWAISIEYGVRKTFTDYIDDVGGDYVDTEQLRTENGPLAADLSNPSLDGINRAGFNRGTSTNKDWYVFYGLMITFKPFKQDPCYFGRGSF
ncbi:MAG: outer membrane beta-barrel protein [Crocinitomicaceae bacterium]|nr:outer membrane beta-barrel protein [Crocinitomicaceae bacterium]